MYEISDFHEMMMHALPSVCPVHGPQCMHHACASRSFHQKSSILYIIFKINNDNEFDITSRIINRIQKF